MLCASCKQTFNNPNGILIKGAFYCVTCSTCQDDLCDESTPDEVKGYLKGQTGVLKILESDFGLVDSGSVYDSYKKGRREGTRIGIAEENERAISVIQSTLHNDSFGGCFCVSCNNVHGILKEITFSD